MKKLIDPLPPALPLPKSPKKRRHPDAVEANRPHQWGLGSRGQPDWLNGLLTGGRQCRVCGVTETAGTTGITGSINADHAGFGDDGRRLGDSSNRVQMFIYEDAKGHKFTSQKELGCPVFILDPLGTAMENRAMLREVDDRVDHTDDRVDNHEDRLARLEAENVTLRAKLEERVDVSAMVEWLAEMVALHAAQKLQTVDIMIDGKKVAALPPPVANLIIDVGSFQQHERERMPVRVTDDGA